MNMSIGYIWEHSPVFAKGIWIILAIDLAKSFGIELNVLDAADNVNAALVLRKPSSRLSKLERDASEKQVAA